MNPLKKIILENKALRWMLIFTNWVYQGIPHADKTEMIYKISFTLVSWVLIFFTLPFMVDLSFIYQLVISFIIAHSINWIFNCNHFVIFIHRMKWLKTTKSKLFKHLISIQEKLKDKDWILLVVSLGGISRGTMSEHSDIDVNIVRKSGSKNAIYSLLFAAIEKKRADYNGIPLDIMISDSVEDCIKKSNGQKNPVVLHDPYNIIDSYYNEKMSINEAKIINKVLLK